jgi:hypothetical protein
MVFLSSASHFVGGEVVDQPLLFALLNRLFMLQNREKGRGDDPAWNMSLKELNEAIAAARAAGDTALLRKLQAIKKQKFRGRRDGS